MIRLEHVTKSYEVGGGLTVLRDANLDVREGEFVGIIGPSGSGKSTLLHIMGLLDRPTHGRVCVHDQDVSRMSDAALSEFRGRSIGFVFQSFHLVPQLTVLENVELPLFYQRVGLHERRRRAREALEGVGLAQRLAHHPGQLSGGECQRTAIARAVVTRPALILADEPTGNLDSRNGAEIIEYLFGLHREGRTLVIITHDPSIAARMPRRVTMRDGTLTEEKAS